MICPFLSKVVNFSTYTKEREEAKFYDVFEVECKQERCACWKHKDDCNEGFCGLKTVIPIGRENAH